MADRPNNNRQGDTEPISSGVEDLIERLIQDGVSEGQERAERIVTDAERRAEWLVEQAHEEAEAIREEARSEAQRLRRSGKEALHTAARDAILELKETLMHRFADQLRSLIATEMQREDFLQRLILELAGNARETAGVDRTDRVEVVLPRDVVGLEELRRNPEELREGTLSYFAATLMRDVIHEGVTFTTSEETQTGIRLRLLDHDIEVDLTDESVATLLLQHLQPRFRALVEGIIK